jgi:hypothetical protein
MKYSHIIVDTLLVNLQYYDLKHFDYTNPQYILLLQVIFLSTVAFIEHIITYSCRFCDSVKTVLHDHAYIMA